MGNLLSTLFPSHKLDFLQKFQAIRQNYNATSSSSFETNQKLRFLMLKNRYSKLNFARTFGRLTEPFRNLQRKLNKSHSLEDILKLYEALNRQRVINRRGSSDYLKNRLMKMEYRKYLSTQGESFYRLLDRKNLDVCKDKDFKRPMIRHESESEAGDNYPKEEKAPNNLSQNVDGKPNLYNNGNMGIFKQVDEKPEAFDEPYNIFIDKKKVLFKRMSTFNDCKEKILDNGTQNAVPPKKYICDDRHTLFQEACKDLKEIDNLCNFLIDDTNSFFKTIQTKDADYLKEKTLNNNFKNDDLDIFCNKNMNNRNSYEEQIETDDPSKPTSEFFKRITADTALKEAFDNTDQNVEPNSEIDCKYNPAIFHRALESYQEIVDNRQSSMPETDTFFSKITSANNLKQKTSHNNYQKVYLQSHIVCSDRIAIDHQSLKDQKEMREICEAKTAEKKEFRILTKEEAFNGNCQNISKSQSNTAYINNPAIDHHGSNICLNADVQKREVSSNDMILKTQSHEDYKEIDETGKALTDETNEIFKMPVANHFIREVLNSECYDVDLKTNRVCSDTYPQTCENSKKLETDTSSTFEDEIKFFDNLLNDSKNCYEKVRENKQFLIDLDQKFEQKNELLEKQRKELITEISQYVSE